MSGRSDNDGRFGS